jgi:hypothetical protein
MTEYCRKMKAMADSLGDLDCPVSDWNLVLNVLRGLNKKYEHLRAIITRSRPFPSFLKLRDDLVLEELQLGPDTTSAPPQAFYSNNSQPPSSSRPLGSGGQGQGQGRGRGRGRGKGGWGYGANHHRQGGHTAGPARNQANGSTSAVGAPPPWPSLYNPWTGTISMYPGPTMGEMQQPSRPQQQQVFLTAPGQPVGLSQHTTPLAPIPLSAQLYAAQQQHQLQQQAQAAYGAQQQQQVAQTPWNPWQGTWDQQSLTSSFNTMTLQQPQSITEWIADSRASNHTTLDSGNISRFRSPTSTIPSSIVVGNGSSLSVTSVGDTMLSSQFYLNNVLVTPGIIKNLLSVRQFMTDNNCSMEVHDSEVCKASG